MSYENCGIYKISCAANGKIYIGSSTQIARRFYLHKRDLSRGKHHSILLQRAWSKYGESAFSFEKILYCAKDSLLEYEQAVMDLYKSYDPSYGMNISHVAGRSAAKCSEERKQKMREERTGKPIFKNNPAAHANMMAAVRRGKDHPFYGKTHTEETRKILSEKSKGRVSWNKGKPSPRKGQKRSEADRIAIRDAIRSRSKNGMTIEKAREIRRVAVEKTMTRPEMAEFFGITKSLVNAIVWNQCWKDED